VKVDRGHGQDARGTGDVIVGRGHWWHARGTEHLSILEQNATLNRVIWLLVYAVVGPGLWGFYALSVVLGYQRMNRLRRGADVATNGASVEILIPAKDEGERVRVCLESVLGQDYRNFSVICVDDRSADQTGAIIDEYAGKLPEKVRAIHVPMDGLPAGWLGKCHALWTAAKQAKAEWILFVDSDVKLEPDALSAALALAVGREYDALSIMTTLECETFLEHLVLPLAAASVSSMCLISLTNDDNRQIAFANGQFFLIRREAYEQVGGHEAVKDHITEDVALMRILKARGYRTRLFLGSKFASTRMHSTWRQMKNGWGRIYSGVSSRKPARIIAAVLVVVSGLLAYPTVVYAIVMRDWRWVAASVTHLVILTAVLMSFYHWSGNRKRYALAFPASAPLLLALYAHAIKLCRTGKVAWRGTSYTYNAATAGKP